ncbi:unnamed protein product [Ambrosiozyma monospora]|uniref:Unnamed protein product n=1 Tax=Ambrosiozyma monospora TaxID=43982 RepID=A0A9W6T8S1_AMBMO|nr:unnamed protein product [Ambrosiozyma monospora]
MTTSKHWLFEPCGSVMLAVMISVDALSNLSQALEPETEGSIGSDPETEGSIGSDPETEGSIGSDPETETKVESHSSTSFEKNMLASAVEQA